MTNYSDRVHDLVMGCLFTPEEAKDSAQTARARVLRGLTQSVGFHPDHIEARKVDIEALLNEMVPEAFYERPVGFEEIPFLADGTQWGEHFNAQELLYLGLAVKRVLVLHDIRNSIGLPYVLFRRSAEIEWFAYRMQPVAS